MNRSGRFLLLFLALVVLLAAPYFLFNGESEICDAAARAKFPGQDLKTSQGVTRYELLQPPLASARRNRVVFIHGVSGPMGVWDKVFAYQKFFQSQRLRYDLFGRGLSDRVAVPYNEALYDRQLWDLLEGLKIEKPVTLIGSSMGAVIAAGFRNRHPEWVKNIVLIGPAGFPIEASPLSKLINLPLIGEYVMGVVGTKTLIAHNTKYFYHPEKFPEVRQAYINQLNYRGSKVAILSTMREMPVQDYRTGYEAVGRSQLPGILLWGRQDTTFPFSNYVKATTYLPQFEFVPVDEAGHLPQYEQSEIVNQAIVRFLQK